MLGPDVLNRPVIDHLDALLRNESSREGRGQELIIRPPDLGPARLDLLRRPVPETRMYSPLGQASRKAAQQLGVSGRLAVELEAEAVEERVIDDRQSELPELPPGGLQPGPDGQTVLGGKRNRQVEDIFATAVGQAVPVQVRRPEAEAQYRLDLRAKLKLDLVQPRLLKQSCGFCWRE